MRLLVLLEVAGGIAAWDSCWADVLRRWEDVVLVQNGQDTTSVKDFVNTIHCDHVGFVAHDGSRIVDMLLEEKREAWSADSIDCYFKVVFKQPQNTTESVIREWRRRGAIGDPVILTNRYRGGLILMALNHFRKIVRRDGGSDVVFFYMDGDTMISQTSSSISQLVARTKAALSRPTTEQRLCGRKGFQCPNFIERAPLVGSSENYLNDTMPTEPFGKTEWDKYGIVITLSRNCHLGYFTHSGAFIFRTSRMVGFLFEILADSSDLSGFPTGYFRKGDQAIWDSITTSMMGVNFFEIRKMCSNPLGNIMRTGCLYPEIYFSRSLIKAADLKDPPKLNSRRVSRYRTSDPDVLAAINLRLTGHKALWGISDDIVLPKDRVAWVCVRWFNSAGCPGSGPLHQYKCGDFLWHLYGCPKKRRIVQNAIETAEKCKSIN